MNKRTKTGLRQVVPGSRQAAFSYRSHRSSQEYNLGRLDPRERDSRRKERLVRYWRQRIGALLAGLVLVFCVLYVLHLGSNPTVLALTSSSSNTFLQPVSTYQVAARKLFAGSVWNGNKITINTAEIEAKLKAQFPELSDVSITLPLMSHRPIVYVAPSEPVLLLKTASGEFVLDGRGKALLPADKAVNLDNLHLPVVTDQSGLKVGANKVALPSTSVAFIVTIVQELQLKHVPIDSLTLPAAAYELDVKTGGAGYIVKFNLHDNTGALQQIGTYLAVRARLAQQQIVPASYIDVRLDGRAYYK